MFSSCGWYYAVVTICSWFTIHSPLCTVGGTKNFFGSLRSQFMFCTPHFYNGGAAPGYEGNGSYKIVLNAQVISKWCDICTRTNYIVKHTQTRTHKVQLYVYTFKSNKNTTSNGDLINDDDIRFMIDLSSDTAVTTDNAVAFINTQALLHLLHIRPLSGQFHSPTFRWLDTQGNMKSHSALVVLHPCTQT